MKTLRNLLALLLVTIASAAQADVTVTALVVNLQNGTTDTYELSTRPTISFAGTGMKIVSEAASTTYQRSAVSDFHFEEVTPTGVKTISASGMNFRYVDGQTIQLSGEAAQQASLYDASGRRIAEGISANGVVTLSLEGQPAGTYIVRTPAQSVKVIKK